MSPLLEVNDLHVDIPLPHGTLRAVRGVSLTADAGEAVGLVGESGSGKSLTLRALLGLLPQPARITSGTIVLDGVVKSAPSINSIRSSRPRGLRRSMPTLRFPRLKTSQSMVTPPSPGVTP